MREESEEGDKGLKARIDLERLRKVGDSKKWLLS